VQNLLRGSQRSSPDRSSSLNLE